MNSRRLTSAPIIIAALSHDRQHAVALKLVASASVERPQTISFSNYSGGDVEVMCEGCQSLKWVLAV
jgi:hypothetical protein